MPLNSAHLGVRLIAATRFAAWERQIADAAQRSLAGRRERVEQSVRTMARAPIVASLPPDPFGLDDWDTDLAGELEPAAAEVFAAVTTDTAHYFTKLTGTGRLPPIDLSHRLDRLVGKMQGLGPDTAERLGSTLTEGTNLGESIDKLVGRVQSVFDVSDARAETIARTEVIGAANGASHDMASAIGDTGIVLEKTWISTQDDRTRETHVEADGQTVPLADMFTVGDAELAYPGDENSDAFEEIMNCMPGSVLVEFPGLRATMRRWFRGDLVVLRFAGGNDLAVTPNHPILRADGRWVPANLFKPGDHCVGREIVGHLAAEPYPQRGPSAIGKVHRAAMEASMPKRVRVSPPDLHGDGCDGEVDVVSVNGHLRNDCQAASDEEVEQFGLTLADKARLRCGLALSSGVCPVGPGGRKVRDRATGPVRSGGQPTSVGYGRALHADEVGGGPPPRLNAGFQQAPPDGRSRYVEAAGQFQLTLAGKVTSDQVVSLDWPSAQSAAGRPATQRHSGRDEDRADHGGRHAERCGDCAHSLASDVTLHQIINVEVVPFEGHVYNLDTGEGWYMANGITCRNCRCTLTYSEPDGSGAGEAEEGEAE